MRVSRWWHGALFAVVVSALVGQVMLLFAGGADANSGDAGAEVGIGTRLVRLVSYFTIQSNMLVAACCLWLTLRPAADGRLWRVLRMDALLGITITGLVYAIVLAPMVHLTGAALAVTVGLHYIAPPATVVGWLVFGPRRRLDPLSVGLAFCWPVLWIVYTFVHGAVTGWYPYPFLDAGELGFATALRNTALVVLVAAVLAAVFFGLDRIRRKPHEAASGSVRPAPHRGAGNLESDRSDRR